MPAEELGGGVDDDVRAVLDRPAQVGRRGGGVDDERDPGLVRHVGQTADVATTVEGFATSSVKTKRVFSVMAARTDSGVGSTKTVSTPKRRMVTSSWVTVPPYRLLDATTWSPAPARAANVRNSADCPLAQARAPSPPSREAMRSSNAATVGFGDARVDVAVLLQREEVRGVGGVLEDEARRLEDRDGPGPGGGLGDGARVHGAGAEAPGAVVAAALLAAHGAILPPAARGTRRHRRLHSTRGRAHPSRRPPGRQGARPPRRGRGRAGDAALRWRRLLQGPVPLPRRAHAELHRPARDGSLAVLRVRGVRRRHRVRHEDRRPRFRRRRRAPGPARRHPAALRRRRRSHRPAPGGQRRSAPAAAADARGGGGVLRPPARGARPGRDGPAVPGRPGFQP